jgi:hypothetical protein
MNDEMMRQLGTLQTTVDNMVKPEISLRVTAPFQDLPGLIGLWYGGRFQRSTGNVPNLANVYGTTNKQDLAYNGNPTFNYLANGTGYANLDGVGDYFSVADNTDLDIRGNESFVANPGLTIINWTNLKAAGFMPILAKWNNGTSNKSYRVSQNATDQWLFQITTDGSTNFNLTHIATTTNVWTFTALRFVPSTSLDGWVNNSKQSIVAGVPATIYNGNASLRIGADDDGNIATIYQSISVLCASALSDAIIQSTFQQTRPLYGV